MSDPLPTEILKAYPDVYGYTIQRERREKTTIKGIEVRIKRYKTNEGPKGIRVSLLENTSELFLKFTKYLAEISNQRPVDEKALGMWSFSTFLTLNPELDKLEGAGFYVYQNHIIFNEEENSITPMGRLTFFVEFFRKKFEIETHVEDDEFAELDLLER